MSEPDGYLLDASALLALLLGEPGATEVELVIDAASIHALNLAEVISKLLQKGVPNPGSLLEPLQLNVIEELSAGQAAACAELHAGTRRLGLSVGDCVCLAVAGWVGMAAVTAERKWKSAVAGRDILVKCVR